MARIKNRTAPEFNISSQPALFIAESGATPSFIEFRNSDDEIVATINTNGDATFAGSVTANGGVLGSGGGGGGEIIPGSLYTQVIGDGTNSSFVITHNFGTRDVFVAFRENGDDYENLQTAWKATSDNTITVNFSSAPSSNSIKVLIYKSLVSATDNPTFTGVTVDNIQIGISGTNEIDTTTGNLTIDSAGGTVSIDDDVTISGTLDVTGEFSAATPSFDGPTQITGELTITGDLNSSGDLNVAGSVTVNGAQLEPVGQPLGTADSPTFAGVTADGIKIGITGSTTIDSSDSSLTITTGPGSGMGGYISIYPGPLDGGYGGGLELKGGAVSSAGSISVADVTLLGGSANSSASSAIAGSVKIDGGIATAATTSTNGSVYIGTTTAEQVYIGRSAKTTTVNGNLNVLGELDAATPSFNGPTIITGSLTVNGTPVPNITISTATPSGGSDGDIWMVYT